MSYYIIEKPNKIYKKPFTGRRVLCSETVLRNGMNKYGGGIIYDSLTGKVYFIPNRKERSEFISFIERIKEIPIKSIGERTVRINVGEMTSNMAVAQIVGLMTLPVGHIYRGYQGIPFGAVPQFSTGAPISKVSTPAPAPAPATGQVNVPSRPSTATSPSRVSSTATVPSSSRPPSTSQIPIPPPPPPRPYTGATRPLSTRSQPVSPVASSQDPFGLQSIPSGSWASQEPLEPPPSAPTSLLQEIKAGKKLKTTPKSETVQSSSSGSGSLLEQLSKDPRFTQRTKATRGSTSESRGSSRPPSLVERPSSTESGKSKSITELRSLIARLYDGPLKQQAEKKLTEGDRTKLPKFVKELEKILALCEGITPEFDQSLYNECNRTNNIDEIKAKLGIKRDMLSAFYSPDKICNETDKFKVFPSSNITAKGLISIDGENKTILTANELLKEQLLNLAKQAGLGEYIETLQNYGCKQLIIYILRSVTDIVNQYLIAVDKGDKNKQYVMEIKVSPNKAFEDLKNLTKELAGYYNIDISDYTTEFGALQLNIEFITGYYNMLYNILQNIRAHSN